MALATAAKSMAEEIGISKNLLNQIRDYIAEVRSEMRRVTWPNKAEIYGMTVMVIITTFLFGLYFWGTDQAFHFLVGRVLKYFLK
jgi:preprotein translocase subunit SecE